MPKTLEHFRQNPHFRSLDLSWKEGIPAAAMQSMIDEYLIPLGLFLGASPVGIGFLVAIPNLLGSFAQFFAVRVVRALGSRLRYLVKGAALQSAILLPVAGLALADSPPGSFF